MIANKMLESNEKRILSNIKGCVCHFICGAVGWDELPCRLKERKRHERCKKEKHEEAILNS